MPLQKQNISISFTQGLDTKTDSRQVMPGKMEVLENSKFTSGMQYEKRNGYTKTTQTASSIGRSISAYQSEITSYDDHSLYSYVPEDTTNVNKGFIQPVDVATNIVFNPITVSGSTPTNFITNTKVVDSATNSGLTLHVFGNRYIIASQATNQVVVNSTTIVGTSGVGITNARCFSLGSYFIIMFIQATARRLEYIAIPIATPGTPGAATAFSSDGVAATLNVFDGVVVGTKLYVAYGKAANSYVLSLSSALAISSTTITAAGGTIPVIGIWADTIPAVPNIWVGLYNSSAVRYYVLESAGLTSFLAITSIATVADIINIHGSSIGSLGHTSAIYYEQSLTYSYSTVPTNAIWAASLTDAGTVGTPAIIIRGVHLFSRIFQLSGDKDYTYFVIDYGPATGEQLQNTYFVVSHRVFASGAIYSSATALPLAIAKIAQGNGLGYTDAPDAQAPYTSVNMLSATKVQFSYPVSTQITITGGVTQSFFSVGNAIVDFANNDAYQFQEIGNVLQVTGGFLWMYDSLAPVEQNFHLFPEDLFGSFADSGGSIVKNPTGIPYQYIAIYQWTDARGNIHRSAPSTTLDINNHASATDTNTNTVKVPCLRITEKPQQTVSIVIFRNTPTAPGGNAIDIFYKVGTVISSVTTDSISFDDTQADASIIGNELLYTTGGVVENSGGPPCSGATIFKNRLFVIDAEDRNVLWFSKQTLETTPVEMSNSFTLFVDPRFGPMTAISVMDDKLIIFKENAIFYITGLGPDNTGANNDFGDATYITSNTGCIDPRSIVVSENGIMFKGNNGIYLLDRGMSSSYIGASVESFNSSRITSAQLIPTATQIQFTLDDHASCLMYDYFYKQWSVYTNHNAVAATVYSDEFTYIDPTGNIFTEAPGVFSDNGTAIYQSLTTSWLSLAGLQGFQRVYRLYLLTEYLSPHLIGVSIEYDYDTDIVQTVLLDATTLAQTNGDVGQWRINIDLQKCQSIRIKITEQVDPTNTTPGAGLNLEAIGLLVGSKLTYPKLPATQSATS